MNPKSTFFIRNRINRAAGKCLLLSAVLLASVFAGQAVKAAGVTIITHGYDGDVTGWITAMAEDLPTYFHYHYADLSTNFTVYTITLTTNGSNYYYQWQRTGCAPFSTDTGEIVVKLDWSQMAGSPNPFSTAYDISTSNVASVVTYVLSQTNTIADLNGHSLIEYPLHLIGHSRGGSLMSEVSLLLGTNGIWVDHLTTLDPHPLNNDGNDDFPISTIDAPVHTYVNVLFHDNYWQDVGIFLDPDGEPVLGAYVRQLDADQLSGGYNNDSSSTSPYHSNVHLWYHGTIDLDIPTSYNDDGTPVTLDAAMRTNWWTAYENQGVFAGFYYSLIGGGDRQSKASPLGLPSDPAIVDGFNQNWDFGAGTSINRTVLPSNNGTWPNIVKFNVIGTNLVLAGEPISTKLYYQYGGTSNLTAEVFLGRDFNPYNSNNIPVLSLHPPTTGTGSVFFYSNLQVSTTNVAPGIYSIYAKITDGNHTRFLYTPELISIVPNLQQPVLEISRLGSRQFLVGVTGVSNQRVVLQSSTDLQNWQSLATNILAASGWYYTNSAPANANQQFYRAILSP